jgi:hypothetical protein
LIYGYGTIAINISVVSVGYSPHPYFPLSAPSILHYSTRSFPFSNRLLGSDQDPISRLREESALSHPFEVLAPTDIPRTEQGATM